MGILAKIQQILKPPKLSDLTSAPNQMTESLRGAKMRHVDVIFLDADCRAGDLVAGVENHIGLIPIIHVKNPSPMGFFDTCSFFNRTTGHKTILARQGEPFSLDINFDITQQQHNDYAEGNIGKDGYQLPIIINRLAYNLKVKNEKYLFSKTPEIVQECIAENPGLNPSLLGVLGEAKLAKDVTDEDTSIVPVTLLIGVFLGMALLALLQAFAVGG